tara:strand:- start:90028 stop:91146 length:1119 start_codon:yes stop_codon:yes gene_type:complete
MKHKVINNSTANLYHLEQFVDHFFPYSQERLKFDQPVTIYLQSDEENAQKMLGKTAYYDPQDLSLTLFVDNRHPKDILRSLSHELVHHAQNCRGEFGGCDAPGWNQACVKDTGPGYAQKDPHMRNMELEAYTKGNIIFRDFEDLIKLGKINIKIDFNEGDEQMSLKEWKNNEINSLLLEKWGLTKEKRFANDPKLDNDGDGVPKWADKDDNDPKVKKEGNLDEVEHDCAKHVRMKESGEEGYVVDHSLTEDGTVERYTVNFDGNVVEDINVDDLTVLESRHHNHRDRRYMGETEEPDLDEGHGMHGTDKKEDEEDKKKKASPQQPATMHRARPTPRRARQKGPSVRGMRFEESKIDELVNRIVEKLQNTEEN